jgi:hypothetical protein
VEIGRGEGDREREERKEIKKREEKGDKGKRRRNEDVEEKENAREEGGKKKNGNGRGRRGEWSFEMCKYCSVGEEKVKREQMRTKNRPTAFVPVWVDPNSWVADAKILGGPLK